MNAIDSDNANQEAIDIKVRINRLTEAIMSGNAVLVRMLAVPGIINIPKMKLSGQTPIMLAVGECGGKSNIDCVKAIINAGVFLNLQDKNEDTALNIACNKFATTLNPDPIKLLLIAEALPNIPNNMGNTPLMTLTYAFKFDDSRVLDCARMLIENGANPNAQNKLDGRTALHMALEHSTSIVLDFVKIMIDAGADVNILDKKGVGALSVAMEKYENTKNMEILNVLISAGAKVNERAKNGKTPLLHLLKGMKMEFSKIAVIEHLVNAMVESSNKGSVAMGARTINDHIRENENAYSKEHIWNIMKQDYCSFANTYFSLALSPLEKQKKTDYTSCNENEGLTDANVNSLIAFTSEPVQRIFRNNADGPVAEKIKSLKHLAEVILRKL